MRILLVVDSLDIGGAERHVTDLALALRATGHRAAVACATGGPLVGELQSANIPVYVLAGRAVKHHVRLGFASRLRKAVIDGAYDVVHAHLYSATVAASLATVGTGCALVVTVHSEGTWQRCVARSVAGKMYRKADALVAVSEPIARQLTARHRVARDRVVILPNALYLPASPRSWDQPWQSAGGPVVGVVSRLHRDKGIDVLLEGMTWVVPRHPTVGTVVIGDGPQRDWLEHRARALGLSERVWFVGCRSDARSLISSFDLLVVPSRTEGSPLVVLEGMAAGVPVVAARVGGIPAQIRHNVDGVLVPPENPRELGDAIAWLLQEPVARREIASAAEKRVVERFPYRNLLMAVEQVYAEARARLSTRR